MFHKFSFALLLSLVVSLSFVPAVMAGTSVPGHSKDKYDQDGNGYPDAGVTTVGKYTSVYAWDANGGWYWDLGDGRVQGTASSVQDLDQQTVTVCNYQVHYRGNFENDPFLDTGWIINNIVCQGYEYTNSQTFNTVIVHETDPRYTGNPDLAIWGTWEYHVDVVGGIGNLARPETPVGSN